MDGFGDWVDFSTRECEGFEGWVLREPVDSNWFFPVMSTLRIVLAGSEIFRPMLDLACPVLDWVAYLWLGYLNDHICYEFC